MITLYVSSTWTVTYIILKLYCKNESTKIANTILFLAYLGHRNAFCNNVIPNLCVQWHCGSNSYYLAHTDNNHYSNTCLHCQTNKIPEQKSGYGSRWSDFRLFARWRHCFHFHGSKQPNIPFHLQLHCESMGNWKKKERKIKNYNFINIFSMFSKNTLERSNYLGKVLEFIFSISNWSSMIRVTWGHLRIGSEWRFFF